MEGYRLSANAELDVATLYEFGIENFGLLKAQTYVLEIHALAADLVSTPKMGKAYEEGSGELRCIPHQAHIIYYTINKDDILIVRVLSQRQDGLSAK